MQHISPFVIIFVTTSLNIISLFSQELQPGSECRECHRSNFAEWRDSSHALSSKWTNPLYRAMQEWAQRSGGEQLAASCQSCHEPARQFASVVTVPMTVVQEGVGCDFCHSVMLEKNPRPPKFLIRKDGAKLGPIKDAISSTHDCEFSKDHKRSEFCLVCHSNLTTSSDLTFCSSEHEWQEFSKAKTRIECQDCHMPTREGRTATLGKMRGEIHSHDFYGAYSEKMLHSAVKLNLTAKVQEDKVYVQVIATNRGAGHYVPTGSPIRFLVLEVVAKNSNGDIIWRNWQSNPIAEDPGAVFMRLLESDDGRAPVPPWEAVRERFDQRLRPDEPRKLVYSIPDIDVFSIEAKLIYRVAPPALLEKLGITEKRYTEPRIMASEIAVPQPLGDNRK